MQFALSSKWFRMSAQFGLEPPDDEEFVSVTDCSFDTCDSPGEDVNGFVGFGFGVK